VKRPLAVLTIPLAVLGFVACGDDDDDNTGTTPSSVDGTVPDATTGDSLGGATLPDDVTIPSLPDVSLPGGTLPGGGTLPTLPDISLPDISLPDISLPDASDIEQQVKDQFVQLGMSEEQAQCLVDQIDLSSGQIPDLSSIMDLLGECDINLGDLNPDG
jgi:hypothetical protein